MVLLGGAFRQVGIGLALSTLLIGLAALLASVVPAWRAAAVEPMVSLRTE
jgi:ABC-type lipoprotein release transport system permease subunit